MKYRYQSEKYVYLRVCVCYLLAKKASEIIYTRMRNSSTNHLCVAGTHVRTFSNYTKTMQLNENLITDTKCTAVLMNPMKFLFERNQKHESL